MLIFCKTTQQHCSCSTTPAQNNSSIIEHLIKLCWAKLRVSKSTRDDQNLFLSFTKLLMCLKPWTHAGCERLFRMLKPFALHPEQLAADDAQQGWMKRLHRAPLKPSCSWCSLLRLWNTKLEEWCSFDFAEATQDQLVEQAPGHVSRCAAAAVHIPSMINHTNTNQLTNMNLSGPLELRSLGASGQVPR